MGNYKGRKTLITPFTDKCKQRSTCFHPKKQEPVRAGHQNANFTEERDLSFPKKNARKTL